MCVIKKPRERRGHSPRWAAEPEKINNKNNNNTFLLGESSGAIGLGSALQAGMSQFRFLMVSLEISLS
jgi:hypothetical protein